MKKLISTSTGNQELYIDDENRLINPNGDIVAIIDGDHHVLNANGNPTHEVFESTVVRCDTGDPDYYLNGDTILTANGDPAFKIND